MKKIIAALLAAFALTAAFMLVRTARFTSRQLAASAAARLDVDRDGIAARLSRAIGYKTISFQDADTASAAEFERFHAFLDDEFPAVHSRLKKEVIGRYSLLYTWSGADDKLKPIALMGHMDVVPIDTATENNWTEPPFSGRMAGGYIWGRGAMDDKVSVLGILEAAELLLQSGFSPRRTIYFAFGHDEEIGGDNSAAKIATLLQSRGVELDYVLDEGSNIVEGILPDVAGPIALIGIAEKGYVSLELNVESSGGHASIPPDHTAIGILSRAVAKLENKPFPSKLTAPIREMFAYLGPEMAWPNRFALANLWLFEPLLRRELAKSPLTNAAIRTTQAATVFNAGVKENVLPTSARAVVNFRILPGETIAGAIEHTRRAISAPEIKITPLGIRAEPSAVSDIESDGFKLLHRTIKQVEPRALVAPSLLVATTDSRHYAALTRNIFRLLPITIRPADALRYHGIDERISLDDYERCVRFYAQLMRES